MALGIEIIKDGTGGYRVKLAGMLDTETSEQLGQRIEEVWADGKARSIRMEVHDLTYISSVGLGVLAKIKKAITAKGGVMVTIGARPQIAKVFEIVKVMPKETMFASREEADAYLKAIQDKVLEEREPAPEIPA